MATTFQHIDEQIKIAQQVSRDAREIIRGFNRIKREVRDRQNRGEDVTTTKTAMDLIYTDLEAIETKMVLDLGTLVWEWMIEWATGTQQADGTVDYAYADIDTGGDVIETKDSSGSATSTMAFNTHLAAGDIVELLRAEDSTHNGTYAVASITGTHTIVFAASTLPGDTNADDESVRIRKIYDA